jgi:hypothetical protein
MTKEQFTKLKAELRHKYETDIIELQKEYAIKNNPFSKGDIIKHCSTNTVLLIESISMSLFTNYPSVNYRGVELKSDLTPLKIQKNISIHQDSALIIRKNGKEKTKID